MRSQISNQSNQGKKVYVGLSGGVDSAVSAALLQKTGYDVTGVYIKVWQPDWISCTWKEERRDAMRVAAHLGIPFVTLDLVKEYKNGVIDYMLSEYARGRTPNPDVMCNREVKFGGFWKWAKDQGANFVSTGHYAQVKKSSRKGKEISMLAGVDDNKDQSYFLWTLNKNDLEHIIFPVGHLEKTDVRRLATKFGLPHAKKRDSQGLCFIGKVDIKDFLRHYVKKGQTGSVEGDVLNKSGEVIGNHPGALFFTLGERHGFSIIKKTTKDEPYYVIGKDMKKNTLTVDNAYVDSGASEHGRIVTISMTNWTNSAPKIGSSLMVRTRYRQPLIKATIMKIDTRDSKNVLTTMKLSTVTDPVTPGQSLVMYKNEECLGGGIIS